MNGLEGRKKRL